MGERKIKVCDLCGEDEDTAIGPPLELNGVVITIGYSKAHPVAGGKTGSWGNRKDAVSWTGEVCTRCFSIVPRLVAQFEQIKGELAGRASADAEVHPIPTATVISGGGPAPRREFGDLLAELLRGFNLRGRNGE